MCYTSITLIAIVRARKETSASGVPGNSSSSHQAYSNGDFSMGPIEIRTLRDGWLVGLLPGTGEIDRAYQLHWERTGMFGRVRH